MLRRLRQPENIALMIALAALVIAPVFCHFSMRLEPPLYDLPEAEFSFQPPLVFPQLLIAAFVITSLGFFGFWATFSRTIHTKSEPTFSPMVPSYYVLASYGLGFLAVLSRRFITALWLPLAGLFSLGIALYLASWLSRFARMAVPLVLMGCASALLALSAAWVSVFPLYELSDQVEFGNQTYSLMVKSYEIGDSEYDTFYAVVSCDSIGWQCHALWRGNYDTLVREIAGGLMIYDISLESDDSRMFLQVERAGSTVEVPLEPPV
jgi:hypothetical protein